MAFIDNFDGFESGDSSAWSTNALHGSVDATITNAGGAYAWKSPFGASGDQIYMKSPLASATYYYRWYFYTNASPGGLASTQYIYDIGSGVTAVPIILLVCNSSNQLFLRIDNYNGGSPVQVGSDYQIASSTWYMLEVKFVASATVGIIEMRVNGNVVATGSGLNTGTANPGPFYIYATGALSGTAPSGNYWTDDVAMGSTGYIGTGQCSAWQGQAGTPTYDAWTKTGLSTSALNWSQTPFNATDNCNSATSGAAETMLVATSTISAGATINACKVAMIAKSSVTSTILIRRRVGGSNTDFTPQAGVTTTDSYSDTMGCLIAPLGTGASANYTPNTAPFTDTITNLSTYEIGAVKQANTNTDQVEDMWLMVDYTPSTSAGSSITIGTNYVEDWSVDY